MKLVPIAKPIRIRIKLGNNEFSSLNDVKNNFSIEELFPLFLDGRLERWLIQIGEQSLSDRVKDIKDKCTEGGIRDRIMFLSLFFGEVRDSLVDFDIENKERSLETYLESVNIDVLKVIYYHTKNISKIDWKSIVRSHLSIDNIEDLYISSEFSEIFGDSWGYEFAKMVKCDNDYKKFFLIIEKDTHNAGTQSNVLRMYINSTRNRGYEWEKIFADELSLSFISYLYQNVNCQNLNIQWGILFANSIQDWNQENDDVEILLKNSSHLSSYYKRCRERGFDTENGKLKSKLSIGVSNKEKRGTEIITSIGSIIKIQRFLQNPKNFEENDHSELSVFLRKLSEICKMSQKQGYIYTEVEKKLAKVSSKYDNEKKYIAALARFYDFHDTIKLKTDLNEIIETYPPAQYLWIYYHKNITRSEIVSTQIEKFKSLEKHICYVVQHLENKRFA